jgi:anti-anti-sigma factor
VRSEPFDIVVRNDDDRLVVMPRGDLDVATGDEFGDALERAMQHDGPVVVDMAGLTFVDSTGINTVLRALRFAANNGTALVVRSAPPNIRRVFEITGVAAVFDD